MEMEVNLLFKQFHNTIGKNKSQKNVPLYWNNHTYLTIFLSTNHKPKKYKNLSASNKQLYITLS